MKKTIATLQFITHKNENYDEIEQALQFCEAGGKWVQLRMKNTDFEHFFNTAMEVKNICEKHNAALIINDNVEIAKQINADGVHLGKNDITVEKAIKILGNEKIIGYTCTTLEDIQNAPLCKIDYIGLGPFRFTKTKKKLNTVLGIKGYQEILNSSFIQKIEIPLIAIGGIEIEDVNTILDTDIFGVAVSGAINNSSNLMSATQDFLTEIERSKIILRHCESKTKTESILGKRRSF